MNSTQKFIPALRYNWLTPLYDRLIGVTMPERKFKAALITDVAFLNGRVLDFGCGTGTLTVLIKQAHPEATVIGIDVDMEILRKAADRIRGEKADIQLVSYDGATLPYPESHFEKVFSCLVFHHLDTESKGIALKEIYRVLEPDGELHIADFGRSDSLLQRLLFNIIRSLDGYSPTDANAKGILPELISESGFKEVIITQRFRTVFGEVQIIKAMKN
jgi:ubiquinone/menaquinone biosynthesis C-methylase UbiE